MAKRARKKRHAYHHGDLRDALIRETVAMVTRDGTAAVSLRELARRLAVSSAAPYRHFATKDELFVAVADQGFRGLRRAEERARDAAGDDVRARLVATGIAYVSFAAANPGHFKIMFSHLSREDTAGPSVLVEGAGAYRVLVECVAAGQARGILVGGDPMMIALSCWANVHGIATLIIDRALALGRGTPERLAEFHINQMIDGVLKR